MNKISALTACLAVLFISSASFAEARHHHRRSTHFGVNIGQVAVAPQPVCYDTYVVQRYPVYHAPVYAPVYAPVAYPVQPAYYEEAVIVRRPYVQAYPTIGFNFGWSWFR